MTAQAPAAYLNIVAHTVTGEEKSPLQWPVSMEPPWLLTKYVPSVRAIVPTQMVSAAVAVVL